MASVQFVTPLHTRTQRDYVGRVTAHDKAECAAVAKQWGADYWDGARQHGYGGYRYDGRWLPVAQAMAAHYGLRAGDRILDVGCGKAYLLYEFTRAVPGIEVVGLDISTYGLAHAKEEVRPSCVKGMPATCRLTTTVSTWSCRWRPCTTWASPICSRRCARFSGSAGPPNTSWSRAIATSAKRPTCCTGN